MKRLLVLLAACASPAPVLRSPADWPADFIIRQSIEVHARTGGQAVDGALDAVVQKRGDTLIVIGLGPMSTRAFTITQRGHTVSLDQAAGPPLPFAPRDLIADVHRVFLTALPAGVSHGQVDGDDVEEVWEHGELRRRIFTRPGSGLHGAVRVEYGEGCRPGPRACRPETVTLSNEWFGYTLTIANDEYEMLE
jgi:hypothetical protein